MATRQGRSGDDRVPGGGERLDRGAHRASGRPARADLPGDQGPHPGDRPVGADAAKAAGGTSAAPRRASSTASPAACRPPRRDWPRRRSPPASAWPASRCCSTATSWPAARRSSPWARSTSPDGTLLAYSTDFTGDERFILRVKDLTTGELLPDEIEGIFYGGAWSADGRLFFYTRVDDAWRPYQVWRHALGTDARRRARLRGDRRALLGRRRAHPQRALPRASASGSKITSEVGILDADDPTGEFQVVAPQRRQGVEYGVEHAGRRLLLSCTTTARENFELATAPLDDRRHVDAADRRTATGTRLLEIDAFAGTSWSSTTAATA